MRWRLGVAETLTIAGFAIAIVVWAVRLEGQVNLLVEALASVKQQRAVDVQQTREDLAYIRARIDAALQVGRTQ